MPALEDAILLRIFVGEEDRCDRRPLYEAIVKHALAMKMAGATVLPGPVGFGQRRIVRSELNVDAGPRFPIVVEIIDTHENIERFLPTLDGMIESGLVTMETVQAAFYGPKTS